MPTPSQEEGRRRRGRLPATGKVDGVGGEAGGGEGGLATLRFIFQQTNFFVARVACVGRVAVAVAAAVAAARWCCELKLF